MSLADGFLKAYGFELPANPFDRYADAAMAGIIRAQLPKPTRKMQAAQKKSLRKHKKRLVLMIKYPKKYMREGIYRMHRE